MLQKAVFLLVRLPATSPHHRSLFLLWLHIPVLLQRLLQPLSLLLHHYLWVSPSHRASPISLPLTTTASSRYQTNDAVLEPPRPPWLVSHPHNPPHRNRSSLHSESQFKVVFKRPTMPWLPLKRCLPGKDGSSCHPPQINRDLPTCRMLQSTVAPTGSSRFSLTL